MTWRFDNREGYRWHFTDFQGNETMTVWGEFTSRGEPYFVATAGVLDNNVPFKTFSDAIRYLDEVDTRRKLE